MRMLYTPIVTTTSCQEGWPRWYGTHHQEIGPPYRRARVLVLRRGTKGYVVGLWTSKAAGEDQALASALQARVIDPIGTDGRLKPRYRKA